MPPHGAVTSLTALAATCARSRGATASPPLARRPPREVVARLLPSTASGGAGFPPDSEEGRWRRKASDVSAKVTALGVALRLVRGLSIAPGRRPVDWLLAISRRTSGFPRGLRGWTRPHRDVDEAIGDIALDDVLRQFRQVLGDHDDVPRARQLDASQYASGIPRGLPFSLARHSVGLPPRPRPFPFREDQARSGSHRRPGVVDAVSHNEIGPFTLSPDLERPETVPQEMRGTETLACCLALLVRDHPLLTKLGVGNDAALQMNESAFGGSSQVVLLIREMELQFALEARERR